MRYSDGALLILVLVIGWSFYRAHRNPNFDFDLFDLIVENGRLSKMSCVFMGSFVLTSWIMVRLTLEGKMSEGLFGAYGALWIAPIVAKLFSPPAPEGTTTVTENKARTTVIERPVDGEK